MVGKVREVAEEGPITTKQTGKFRQVIEAGGKAALAVWRKAGYACREAVEQAKHGLVARLRRAQCVLSRSSRKR